MLMTMMPMMKMEIMFHAQHSIYYWASLPHVADTVVQSNVGGKVIGKNRMSVFVSNIVCLGSVLSSKSPERLPSLFPVEPELVELPCAASPSAYSWNWNSPISGCCATTVCTFSTLSESWMVMPSPALGCDFFWLRAHTGNLVMPFSSTRIGYFCEHRFAVVKTVHFFNVCPAFGAVRFAAWTGCWFWSSLELNCTGSSLVARSSTCDGSGKGTDDFSCCFSANAVRMSIFWLAWSRALCFASVL